MIDRLKEQLKEQMKEWEQKAKTWWSTLNAREKQAVSIGGIVLGIFIIYAGIWSPYVNHMDDMRKQIETNQKTLQWMTATDKEIKKIEGQAKNKSKPITAVVLLSVLQKQTQQAGLAQYMTQLKQATNDSVEMHFQKVGFDSLIKLLSTAIKTNNISISQMSASAQSAPGTVDADIMIKIE